MSKKTGSVGHWPSTLVIGLFFIASCSIASAQVVRYVHTDGLGSVSTITDANRNTIERREYEPYGANLGAPIDGVGYTGHVMDAATGLTYMQQRYYDPSCGCFLSVDPITAYDSGNWRQFNRYAYAFSNPYRFKDPDGRIVQYAFSNGATITDGAAVLNHWMKSPTVMKELNQISSSDTVYTIEFNRGGNFEYKSALKTVQIDVSSGLRIRSSGEIQSPALGGAHELSHAAQNDRVGDKALNASLVSPQTVTTGSNGETNVIVGTAPEETRATNFESKAAAELGEPSRQNYHDAAGTVNVCSPTSNTEC